jgi:hypothetical protein
MPMFSTVTAGGGGATEGELGGDAGGAVVDADDTAGGAPTEAVAEGGGSVDKDRWHAIQVRATSGASQRIGAFLRGPTWRASSSIQGIPSARVSRETWPDEIPAPQAWLEFDVDSVERATTALAASGYRMLVKNKKEPWGRIVSRFLSPEGLLHGITFTPSMREERT